MTLFQAQTQPGLIYRQPFQEMIPFLSRGWLNWVSVIYNRKNTNSKNKQPYCLLIGLQHKGTWTKGSRPG